MLISSKNMFPVEGLFSGMARAFQSVVTGTAYAELGSDGQVSDIKLALHAGDGKGFYACQCKKN
ncbi:hypothetical protein [Roseateles oligotrophus]|uniref:Uncharacterized protein n=1 Tax=Roseateles oligotrophus TaxID=1769250 RepID=A0ABT2Y8A1_9BURK|nr:hypothetical protein [Roseateles oligotrophus]MCV2366526.1 hypothetical protein [Roseateles oligotrophus]